MDFHLPEIGEGIYEAEMVRWLVQVGDTVKRGQTVLEVLTDKATMEVPSPFAGTITALQGSPGDQIKIGQVILSYKPIGKAGARSANQDLVETVHEPARQPPREVAVPSTSQQGNGRSTAQPNSNIEIKAAPSVRHLARKLGIDLSRIAGSGPQGRILIGDLTNLLTARPEKQPVALPSPDYGTPGTRIKLQGVRRKIAEHMVHAKKTVPHYSYVDECDVTELVRIRQSLKEAYATSGVKITFLAFIVKAVVAALKEVPIVNASLDEAGGDIVLHDKYHIGIAVATPSGLVVPVIHDADNKDLFQIARDIDSLSVAAKTGKIKLEELRGGTFTVTSIGNIGGLISTPVINHPEVGIIGIGKVVKRPVYDEHGNIRPADIVYLSFSFDHRVLDGAVGAAFGNAVIRRLQRPLPLMLPEKIAAVSTKS